MNVALKLNGIVIEPAVGSQRRLLLYFVLVETNTMCLATDERFLDSSLLCVGSGKIELSGDEIYDGDHIPD
jgi:hypothetical protein